MSMRSLCSLNNLVIRSILSAEKYVLFNGCREQSRLLAHQPHLGTHPLDLQLLNPYPIQTHLSSHWVIEPLQKCYHRRLPRPTLPNQRHSLPCRNSHTQPVQYCTLWSRRVRKFHPVKFNFPVNSLQNLPFLALRINSRNPLYHLLYTLRRRTRLGKELHIR
ncbi:hypothetical protein V8G54_021167 [Vigna mungo]|uniref:Uncharacterized protein n=1 Tax=Vigna mungo TaxID=3915 RepID=A0AAQ3NF12_VIGMU